MLLFWLYTLESFILCNEIIYVVIGNCNLKTFFDFSYYFVFTRKFICIFSLILKKDFLFCIRKAKKIEKYEMCVWSIIQTTSAFSIINSKEYQQNKLYNKFMLLFKPTNLLIQILYCFILFAFLSIICIYIIYTYIYFTHTYTNCRRLLTLMHFYTSYILSL